MPYGSGGVHEVDRDRGRGRDGGTGLLGVNNRRGNAVVPKAPVVKAVVVKPEPTLADLMAGAAPPVVPGGEVLPEAPAVPSLLPAVYPPTAFALPQANPYAANLLGRAQKIVSWK